MKLLQRLKSGDTLAVYKLDRFARSVSQFVRTFEDLQRRGIHFRSLTESIETTTPHGRMFIQLLSVFAEFERELIRERCLAGQQAARARGQTWGRRRIIADADLNDALNAWRSGVADQATLADMLGVSVSTLRDNFHRIEGRGRHRLRADR